MHRYILCISFLCIVVSAATSQELYIMTEPASNMPAHSIGIRLTNKLMPMQYDKRYSYRLDPEIMIGINKNLMLHGNLYASNMFTGKFKFEGGSAYAKYRFLSVDNVHSHFRMSAFGKISLIDNPAGIEHTVMHHTSGGQMEEIKRTDYSHEIELDGNNTGFSTGLIATQLLHKLALSVTTAYTGRWNNINHNMPTGLPDNTINYSFSAGYLLFPKTYTNYSQTNMNLYIECIGSSVPGKGEYYVDVAPGIQFIFNSISRLDIAYRSQLAGNMPRYNKSVFLLRYEYNLLNIFNKKKI